MWIFHICFRISVSKLEVNIILQNLWTHLPLLVQRLLFIPSNLVEQVNNLTVILSHLFSLSPISDWFSSLADFSFIYFYFFCSFLFVLIAIAIIQALIFPLLNSIQWPPHGSFLLQCITDTLFPEQSPSCIVICITFRSKNVPSHFSKAYPPYCDAWSEHCLPLEVTSKCLSCTGHILEQHPEEMSLHTWLLLLGLCNSLPV